MPESNLGALRAVLEALMRSRLQPVPEQTRLSPLQEVLFRRWIDRNKSAPGVAGWDQPDAAYDMRGWWADREVGPLSGRWRPGDHGVDTYKQHGHPTFSIESKYSRGLQDGGRWLPLDDRGLSDEDAEKLLVQPPMPSHSRLVARPSRDPLIDRLKRIWGR